MKRVAKTAAMVPLFLVVSMIFCSGSQVKERDLGQRYRDFLKLTHYIILPQEKDVFMQLSSDRERDIFIEAFWKQRDPTPGTPQNEYQAEHIKRFDYANEHFSRESVKEGWMTDRGEFYIILGPPVSIERFDNTPGLYPTQVWYYYGDQERGLPPHFALAFYQRGGSGEYKLYDPVSDGPQNLMIQGRQMAVDDYAGQYQRIMELAPTLAPVSLSMIPGEIPYNFQPSPRNALLVADIILSPKKDVKVTYATHFLDYRGMVTTEYMTNYVDSDGSVALIQDPRLGINFMHLSISPKNVSVDYFEPKDQYYCNFQLVISLRVEDDIIFQYKKDFPFYFPPEDLDKIRGSGVSIEDSFPIIPGRFRLVALLQNSVGKEFTVLEKDVSIPDDSGAPLIIGPVLAYGVENHGQDSHMAFKVLGSKLVVDPKNTFASLDDISFFFNIANCPSGLWEEGRVRISIAGLKPESPSEKFFDLKLRDYPFNRIMFVFHAISARELSPDYYEMKLNLIDGRGAAIDYKSAAFVISSAEVIPHPITQVKSFPLSNAFLYFYMVAAQHERMKEYDKAEAMFNRAYALNPDYKKGLIDYADFLLKIGRFDESLELADNLKADEALKFQYYLIRGRAYMGMERYSDALENLLEGNKIYDSDVTLLNSLGFCYYRSGETKKALDVLGASLRLNPEQPQVEKLINEISKRRHEP